MTDHEPVDWGRLYRENVAAVASLAADLTDEQLHTHLPATPAWNVHDVLAHLAGGADDAVTGRMDDAPGPEWTARHVGERAGLPVDLLMVELHATTEAVVASTVDNPRPALVWNIAVHHADLHEALGLARLADRFWAPVLDAVGPWRLGDLPASVRCGDRTWGRGGPVVEVDPYELFRAVFSRRSRVQMQAWGYPVLDGDQLDSLCVFGPREDDQPVPA